MTPPTHSTTRPTSHTPRINPPSSTITYLTNALPVQYYRAGAEARPAVRPAELSATQPELDDRRSHEEQTAVRQLVQGLKES